jgi:hypothetical protein
MATISEEHRKKARYWAEAIANLLDRTTPLSPGEPLIEEIQKVVSQALADARQRIE